MENKEIYIDGIDVSGCGYFDDNECMIAGFGINEAILYCHCKSNPNCYYKQLERKEQKLEKIKGIVNTHKRGECITCSEFDSCLGHPYCDKVILRIIEE